MSPALWERHQVYHDEEPAVTAIARRMFELTEPIGALPYSADEPNETMFALGFTNYWDTYFAGRAAPLGASAPAELVDALFYSFAPGEVARHLPKVWRTTTPEAALAARYDGCARALRRVLDEHLLSPDVARATELLLLAAVSAPWHGRPMYAALRALPLPTDPAERLFHAAALLREHRGDGHVAALVSEGVGGLEAHVLLALDLGMRAEQFGRLHHLPRPQVDAVVDGLRDRGLVDADGGFTTGGRALKQRVEDLTDRLAAPAYQALSGEELSELERLLQPVAAELLG